MTRQYRGGQQATGTGSVTSVATTIPAGAQVGDLCLLWWVTPAVGKATKEVPPAGWNYLGTTQPDDASNLAAFIYWKRLEVADPGTVITFTNPGGATRQLAGCGVYYDDTGALLTPEALAVSLSATLPSLLTVAANCHGVAGVISRRSADVETFTPPAGYVERLDTSNSIGTGGKSGALADKLATVAPGSELGGGSFVPLSGDGTEHSWVVSVKPLVVAPTNPGAFLSLL